MQCISKRFLGIVIYQTLSNILEMIPHVTVDFQRHDAGSPLALKGPDHKNRKLSAALLTASTEVLFDTDNLVECVTRPGTK